MNLTLSQRQYPLLQTFADLGRGNFLTIAEAQRYDQRPFRSMLYRGWITYRAGRGFHLTAEGGEAWHRYHNTNILRQNPQLPLTSYFDATAYGLPKP